MKFLSPISSIDVTHSGNAVLKIQSDSTTNSHAAKLQLSHMRPSGDAYSSTSLYMDTFTTYLSADEAFAIQTNGLVRIDIDASRSRVRRLALARVRHVFQPHDERGGG